MTDLVTAPDQCAAHGRPPAFPRGAHRPDADALAADAIPADARPAEVILIASDWHLGSYSPPAAGRLALAFLRRVRAAGVRVVLNGDIFEGLFEPLARAERVHGAARDLIATMTATGQLLRIAGNHDVGTGAPLLVVEPPGLGRVLIAHGHFVDPVHASRVSRLGDAISRRFGTLAVVRGAASLVEGVARAAAGATMERVFRQRCRARIAHADCTLGVFGHTHQRHAARDDRYTNAGHLSATRLEYLVLTPGGVALRALHVDDLSDAGAPDDREGDVRADGTVPGHDPMPVHVSARGAASSFAALRGCRRVAPQPPVTAPRVTRPARRDAR